MGPLTPPLQQRNRPFQFATISHVPSSSFDANLHTSRTLNDDSPVVQDGTDGSEDDTQSNDSSGPGADAVLIGLFVPLLVPFITSTSFTSPFLA